MAAKRQIVLGAASLAALYAGVAGALGLGEIQLESALNQPLNAVIELQGADGLGPDDVIVRLAQTTDFDNAGIDKPYFLNDLRFTPVLQNRRLAVQVRSSQPVREPYLNFLVELRRPNGRMLREYTVLLDPPLYTSAAPAPVAAAPVVAQARPRPSAAPARSAPRPQAPLPNLTPQPDAGSYTTVSGDSLWAIAERSRPAASVSIGDTMTAIHALNQQAFVDGDINRLKVGQTLVLPTAQQLGASGGEQPVRESAPSAPSVPAPQPASEQRIAAEPEGIAADEVAVAAAGDAQGRLRIEEDAVSEAEAESAVLASRLNELEGRFNTLLSELDSRDRQIASLQAELEVLNAAREAEEAAAARTAVGGMLGEGEGGDAVSPTGSDDPVAGSIAKEVPVAAEESKSSFVWWSVLLAVLAFLVGWLISRKRSEPAEERFVPPARPAPMARPAEADSAASAVRVVAPAAVAAAAAGATAAESDVADNLGGIELYITYGRFPEARDALENAIAEEPERLELRFKQARVMGELGDSDGFAEQAEAIRNLGGDMQRVDQLRARFPQLDQLAAPADTVEDIADSDAVLEDADLADSQLNLNDFTLDPDWDLIEGLNPTPARKSSKLDPVTLDDDVFESSLHEFPEIEELDDLDDFDQQDNFSTLNDERDKR